MKKILSILLLVSLLLSATSAFAETELMVLAAASLTDALTEIGDLYTTANPDIKLTFSFASSGALQTQIEQGAPADLFISAAQRQMTALADQAMVDTDTRIDLLENKVVLILPQDKETPASFETISEAPVIAIGDPDSVPAGQYAMEIFNSMGIADALTGEQGKLILAKDVREVLTYVSTANVDAGIVYATDALTDDQVKIVASAPEGTHVPVIYPAAVLSGSALAEDAKAFLAFLTTPEASAIFENYGFTALVGE